MVIMRSEEIRTMSKKFKDKVRRKHVNWMSELKRLGNPDLFRSFFDYKCKLYRGKSLSDRRCAYYALKNYYHTTTINELQEKLYEV